MKAGIRELRAFWDTHPVFSNPEKLSRQIGGRLQEISAIDHGHDGNHPARRRLREELVLDLRVLRHVAQLLGKEAVVAAIPEDLFVGQQFPARSNLKRV